MQIFLKEISTQTIKEIFYKFLTIGRGCFSFMLKHNVRAFLQPIDSKDVESSH